jgi:hypothetical protein
MGISRVGLRAFVDHDRDLIPVGLDLDIESPLVPLRGSSFASCSFRVACLPPLAVVAAVIGLDLETPFLR